MDFTDDELDFIRDVLSLYIGEGFDSPPYDPEFYDLVDKLGMTQADFVPYYDIRRPASSASE